MTYQTDRIVRPTASMETTLHRQLKERYAADGAPVEQRVGRYRIDVVQPGRLVEIQLGVAHGDSRQDRDAARTSIACWW